MSPTNSSPYGLIRASSLKAAAFPNCAMCNAQPSLLVKVGTSFVAASFDLCAMCHTDSSVHNLICTSLAATSLDLCSMRDADSSPDDFFSTPHETTSFHLHHCTMRDTNPSSNGPVCTSVQAVHGFTFLILVLISDRDFLATDLSFSPCIFFLLWGGILNWHEASLLLLQLTSWRSMGATKVTINDDRSTMNVQSMLPWARLKAAMLARIWRVINVCMFSTRLSATHLIFLSILFWQPTKGRIDIEFHGQLEKCGKILSSPPKKLENKQDVASIPYCHHHCISITVWQW